MASNGHAMKVTTVRFGADLWRLLQGEADRVGISVSQYIREAALARAAGAVAARGADPLGALGGVDLPTGPVPSAAAERRRLSADPARRMAAELRSEAAALSAQSQQARRRADALMRERGEATTKRPRHPVEAERQE